MAGKLVYDPTSPRFLLEEALVPSIAEALGLVGYDFIAVTTAISKGAKDPEIIEWCNKRKAVWVHADDRAKKQHKVLLQTSGIQTLWIYRKQGQMTGKEQLRILSFVLPQLIRNFEQHPKIRHYRASAPNEYSKPSLTRITL